MTGGVMDQSMALVIQTMAGAKADGYIHQTLFPVLGRVTGLEDPSIATLRQVFSDPYLCLRAIYGHYAFSRRGRDRGELASMSVEALDRLVKERTIEAFIEERDATALWAHFETVCSEHGKKPQEQLNRGVLSGFAELAQEIRQQGGVGSIAEWLAESAHQTGRIEDPFLRMVDVRGVGPKLSSFLCRDVIFLFQLEEVVSPIDRIYAQPIDHWLRLIAPYVVEELAEADAADWVLAGKLAKAARRAGVSGVRFNMGVSYVGNRECLNDEGFVRTIKKIGQSLAAH